MFSFNCRKIGFLCGLKEFVAFLRVLSEVTKKGVCHKHNADRSYDDRSQWTRHFLKSTLNVHCSLARNLILSLEYNMKCHRPTVCSCCFLWVFFLCVCVFFFFVFSYWTLKYLLWKQNGSKNHQPFSHDIPFRKWNANLLLKSSFVVMKNKNL